MSIDVTIGSMSTKSGETLNDLADLAVSTMTHAQQAVSNIDLAFADLNDKRATLGAQMNRLEFALNNIEAYGVNMTDSRSRIKDTDYAETMAELARVNIVRQAGVAMLAQANVQPQAVLQLLQ
jgi:flagellin